MPAEQPATAWLGDSYWLSDHFRLTLREHQPVRHQPRQKLGDVRGAHRWRAMFTTLPTTPIDRATYALSILWRVTLYATVTIALPLAKDPPGGALGEASGLVFWLFFGLIGKTLLYVIFAVSLLGVSSRRAATLGMPPVVGLAVALIVYADVAFGTVLMNGVLGELGADKSSIGFPWHLAAGFVVIGTLLVLSGSPTEATPAERFGQLYVVWLVLVMALAAQTALALLRNLLEGVSLGLSRLISIMFGWYFEHLPVSIALASAVTAACLWLIAVDRGWLGTGSTPPVHRVPRSSAPVRGTTPPRTTFGQRRSGQG